MLQYVGVKLGPKTLHLNFEGGAPLGGRGAGAARRQANRNDLYDHF